MSSPGPAPIKIIFFGTAELAAHSLKALLACGEFVVTHVVTQPDKPKGRDLRLSPSPVKEVALAAGLPILQPKKARAAEFIAEVRSHQPDLLVVAAYGQILPQELLDVAPHGSLNVHASLLPRHRGAAPIQWAIIDGDKETGVTIMKMDAGLDTGPMLTKRTTPIMDDDTGQTLHDRLARIGGELLVETVPQWVAGQITPEPQPEGATYARKISKADGEINWNEPAEVISRKLRAFTPWPGAFTWLGGNTPRLLKILQARPTLTSGIPGTVLRADSEGALIGCGSGSLLINELQREGGKRLSAAQFLQGNPLPAGTLLGKVSAAS